MSNLSEGAQRARDNQARGICSRCSRPLLDGYSLCVGHMVRARMSQWAVQRPECKPYRPSYGKGSGNDALYELACLALQKLEEQKSICAVSGEPIQIGVNAQLDHIQSVPDRPDLAYEISNLRWVSERANKRLNRGKAGTHRKPASARIELALTRLMHQSESWHPEGPHLQKQWLQIRQNISSYLELCNASPQAPTAEQLPLDSFTS